MSGDKKIYVAELETAWMYEYLKGWSDLAEAVSYIIQITESAMYTKLKKNKTIDVYYEEGDDHVFEVEDDNFVLPINMFTRLELKDEQQQGEI